MTFEPEALDSIEEALVRSNVEDVHRILDAEGDRSVRTELLYEITDAQLVQIVRLLEHEPFALLIEDLDASTAADLIARMPVVDAALVLGALDPDDATDVINGLAPDVAEPLLAAMDPGDATAVRDLLLYPPDTAGGRMTPEFITISGTLRADEAINEIRRVAEEAETLSYVYVTDRVGRLLGVVSMRNLVVSRPHTPVADLMVVDVITVRANEDQEQAVRLLNNYNLLALPVVDAEGHLVGIVTADDVAQVMQEEATEDFHRGAAVTPLPMGYRRAPIRTLYQKRAPWLVALVFVNVASSGVIAAFEGMLEATIALVFFVPLLIASGGNTGAQSATLVVRAIATDDLRLDEWLRTVWKEIRVGLSLALTMGVAAAILGLFRGGVEIGLIVFLAMAAIVLVANLMGAILPLVLSKIGVDPATASGPLITSVVDVVGLLIYFSIAALVLTEVGT